MFPCTKLRVQVLDSYVQPSAEHVFLTGVEGGGQTAVVKSLADVIDSEKVANHTQYSNFKPRTSRQPWLQATSFVPESCLQMFHF